MKWGDMTESLARIIHDGSSRNRAVAKRDRRAEPRGREAYLKQYVDRLSGEPACLDAGLRVQVRRHRACEVERPLYDPGEKK